MSFDVQQRIFEPFFTTRPRGQGTGLGLAVAADLVSGAGGEITVQSEPERGSTFRIRFPRPGGRSNSIGSTPPSAPRR